MTNHSRGQARGIERLYLDFDSFFASAEQHFNPDLRGKPVGVVPLDSPHTGCIAVSREAKALGVKSGSKIAVAREVIPDMIFVVARHDVYVRLHKRILDVIEACVPVANVRSIDEVVCHLTPREAAEGEALVARIKSALSDAFSEGLTCSIGMAPTELLAKIAAEMNKPDGHAIIPADALPDRLADIDLDDLPGISKGIKGRLDAAKVHSFADLWALAPKQARAIWGSVEGERFWNGIHGYHTERPETKKSMFGHSRMLPRDWRNPEKVDIVARELLVSASRRLRRADVRASKLLLSFKGGGQRDRSGDRSPDLYWNWEGPFSGARDDHTFMKILATGLDQAHRTMKFAPISVSVVLHGLEAEDEIMGNLFAMSDEPIVGAAETASREKWEKVSDLMDSMRTKLGPQALSLGPRSEIPGGYIGAKIAFGRIPEMEDFGDAPVADEDTHFVTF
ncbi:Y-family DNA polymerase [Loktanella salsilacus]|uniref:Y-family DNA polymerase n=1 Tax=Loktanella salsilacus TaxID=195913 RepID=UPI003736E5A9